MPTKESMRRKSVKMVQEGMISFTLRRICIWRTILLTPKPVYMVNIELIWVCVTSIMVTNIPFERYNVHNGPAWASHSRFQDSEDRSQLVFSLGFEKEAQVPNTRNLSLFLLPPPIHHSPPEKRFWYLLSNWDEGFHMIAFKLNFSSVYLFKHTLEGIMLMNLLDLVVIFSLITWFQVPQYFQYIFACNSAFSHT